MNLNYTVHSCVEAEEPRRVIMDGEEVIAKVVTTVVELIPADDPSLGTLTLRFRGLKAVETNQTFEDGDDVVLTVTAKPKPAASA